MHLSHQCEGRKTQEVVRSRQEAIHCWARGGEYHNDDTGHHVIGVGRYSALIADELSFSKSAIDSIEQTAQLHDVEKIGIPDSILHKPGKLDQHEFALSQTHRDIGRRMINPLSHEESSPLRKPMPNRQPNNGSIRSPVLKLAAVIAATHHENGTEADTRKNCQEMQFLLKRGLLPSQMYLTLALPRVHINRQSRWINTSLSYATDAVLILTPESWMRF